MLDQPEDKRTVMRKDVFIKGKQNTTNDVLAFISNIIVFARFWVKIDKEDTNEMPYIIQMLVEIADFLSSTEYLNFDSKYRKSHKYMSHTLVFYIFNIFSIFVKMAKNPHVVRKFKISNTIDQKETKIGQIMYKSLLDNLQLCSATSSLQNLFANPASSYYLFFPKEQDNINTNGNNKRPYDEDRKRPYVEDRKRPIAAFSQDKNQN